MKPEWDGNSCDEWEGRALAREMGRLADWLVRRRPQNLTRVHLDEVIVMLRRGEKALVQAHEEARARSFAVDPVGRTSTS